MTNYTLFTCDLINDSTIKRDVNMDSLYWEYETSCGSQTCISLRGNCKISRSDFETYVDEFIEKYKDRGCQRDKTSILDRSENYSQYCAIVTLHIDPSNEKIDYPGYHKPY